MGDRFKSFSAGLSSPAERHYTVTPSDTIELDPRPRSLYVNADGDLALELPGEIAPIVYHVVAGQILPLRPVRVHATGTTATVIAWD
jgi:hypothetical protein